MIHYTLLPPEEMKALRHEYRVRFFIILAFFVSCGIVLGIISLIPAYMLSRSQEADMVERTQALEQSRKASGADQIEKDLEQAQIMAEKISADQNKIVYSDSLQKIVSHRTPQVTLSSFQITRDSGTSTPYEVVVAGKAATRDALLTFKSGLENDPAFSSVDLPLSDLAESKDISFSLKLTIK